MFAGNPCGDEQTADVVTEEENGTARCFVDVHAHLEKGSSFQHIGSRGDLNCEDGQKLEVEQLEEAEEKTIEESLKSIEDLGQQEELMIDSSNETMGYYVFKTDKLCVNAGVDEDSSHDGTVMNEVDCCQVKYDEYLPDEDQIGLLQQKEFIYSLFYKMDCFNEDMTVVYDGD